MIIDDEFVSRVDKYISYSWYSTAFGIDNHIDMIRMKIENNHILMITKRRRPKNKVFRIREEKGLRQLDLARKLDVYQSEVSAIERGERIPSVYLAKKIARALGKRVEEVF